MDDANWNATAVFNTWTGADDNDWANAANWSLISIPGNESVGIYPGGNNPVITGSPSLRNLYLASGVSVTNNADIITTTGNVFLNSNLSLPASANTNTFAGSLFVASGVALSLDAGSKLTLSNTTGALNNAGTVAILSPNTLGASGSLITLGGITNTGTMTIQRWLSGGSLDGSDYTWHSIGLPVADQPAGNYFTTDYLYGYDEATNGWTNITDINQALERGNGYILKTVNGDKMYTFSGTFNTGTYIFNNLTNTTNDVTHGYHFVSNPYPSALRLPGVGLTNIDDAFWVWDPVGNNYLSYQVAGNVGPLGRFLHPCQGFFIRVAAGFSGSNQFRFDNADRTHNINFSTFKSAAMPVPRIVVKILGTTGYDELWINNLQYPNLATKFMSFKTSAPQIYTSIDVDSLSIANFESITDETVLPLYFFSSQSGRYSLTLKTDSLPGLETWVHDKKLNTTRKLDSLSMYSFDHVAGYNRDRFELFFMPKSATPNPSALSDKGIAIVSGSMKIGVKVPWQGISEISLFDQQGRLLKRVSSADGLTFLGVAHKGVYLIKVSNSMCTETVKTIVTY